MTPVPLDQRFRGRDRGELLLGDRAFDRDLAQFDRLEFPALE